VDHIIVIVEEAMVHLIMVTLDIEIITLNLTEEVDLVEDIIIMREVTAALKELSL
jgi:hypothetical protein